MAPERVLEHLKRRLPHFEAGGAPSLRPDTPGADLWGVDVWHVPGRPAPVVVKTVVVEEAGGEGGDGAEAPGLVFEARSLEVLGPTGALAEVSNPDVRPPRLIDYDELADVAVEEDPGPYPHLGAWLAEGRSAGELGQHLGRFVAALHMRSRGRYELAGVFENHPGFRNGSVHAAGALADRCRAAGFEAALDVLAQAETSVRRQGECLVVGRLSPEAVLVSPQGLRVVDWTAAHFGSPAEDIGYLSAHLWMRIHRAPTVHAAVQASIILRDFLRAYAAALAARPDAGYEAAEVDACALHFGTTLLASAVAAGGSASLYGGLPPDSPVVREAISIALRHLRAPEDVDMFSILRPAD